MDLPRRFINVVELVTVNPPIPRKSKQTLGKIRQARSIYPRRPGLGTPEALVQHPGSQDAAES